MSLNRTSAARVVEDTSFTNQVSAAKGFAVVGERGRGTLVKTRAARFF